MSTLATLNVVLNGDIGGFLKSMKQAEEQSSSSSNIIQKALDGIGNVATLAAGATIAGVAAIGAAAFSSAMQFDDAFDTIAIGTGATGDALDGLKKDFQNIYTSFPTDTDNAAKVVTELNKRLGVTGQNLTDLAGPVLEASRLLGGDAQQNAALFSRVIGDWLVTTRGWGALRSTVSSACPASRRMIVAGRAPSYAEPLEASLSRSNCSWDTLRSRRPSGIWERSRIWFTRPTMESS